MRSTTASRAAAVIVTLLPVAVPTAFAQMEPPGWDATDLGEREAPSPAATVEALAAGVPKAVAVDGGDVPVAEDVADDPDPWTGELGAGFVSSSGNSSSRAGNIRMSLGLQAGRFKHNLKGEALHTRDEGETTAERYTAGYKVDFNFTSHDFAFAAVEFEKDLFAGVRERTSETVGYGRRLLKTEAHAWNVELGGGLRQTEFQEPEDGTSTEDLSESEAVGRFATDYTWKISETSVFKQTLSAESGASNTAIESLSELRLSIIGNLFAALSYTVRHNTEVAEDTERTDSYTAVNLSYAFGD